jgi:hypothetical protein
VDYGSMQIDSRIALEGLKMDETGYIFHGKIYKYLDRNSPTFFAGEREFCL